MNHVRFREHIVIVRAGRASTVPTRTPVSPGCPRCVSTRNSGKFSCCARGGAWFKNCGSHGDSNFDHTWLEGVRACTDYAAQVKSRDATTITQLYSQSSHNSQQHITVGDNITASGSNSRTKNGDVDFTISSLLMIILQLLTLLSLL